ncbi:981_t:CDS:2 [Acaulospora colombiana]|uniref:981_t:CDS:1 n=1 Tax=Acaulospora colombiana TaxID=27376 RepID=A0ACA9KXH8_9GLOM|nr:981_t:CDS:2 [Acaulospora colombiana]
MRASSVEIGPNVDGETRVRRSVLSPNELVTTPIEGIKTVYDLLPYCAKTYGTKPALGYRKIETVVEEEKEITKVVNGETRKEKKTWKYFQLSGFIYLNYLEALEQAKNIGCFSQSIILTTAYDTLGEESVLSAMNEAEVHAIFTNASLLPTIKKIADRLLTVKHIIYDGEPEGNILEEFKSAHSKINVVTLDEVKQLGKDNPVEPNPPEPQDLCCIMYTSGSTGNPKGMNLIALPSLPVHYLPDVLAKVNASGLIKQKMFNGAFRSKRFLRDKGGAPIFKETHEFITIVLAPLLLGYGMTENCGGATLMTAEETTSENWGIAGSLFPSIEVKLVDVPDAGYFSTNKPCPQGEVWLRGPMISKGYYKNPQVTEETFTEDGWLRTGDIGEFTASGSIKIIDRKKNLVKLAHGEYIALEKLESVYRSVLHVGNICVFADSLQRKPVAVILPTEARIMELAEEKGLKEQSFEELCDNKVIISEVFNACQEQAKRAGLKPAEFLSSIVLVSDEWTPQNGLLTAANKLKRIELQKKYKEKIDYLYASNREA